jgi:NAD(P)-dependent dehydrogenase (short-subunit alcohol dehydrogenase family)
MDLSGRVAAITGASSGIGLAVAQHLAREGVAVAIAARRAERLDEAVRDIRASGGRAEAVVADVTSEEMCSGWFITRARRSAASTS